MFWPGVGFAGVMTTFISSAVVALALGAKDNKTPAESMHTEIKYRNKSLKFTI